MNRAFAFGAVFAWAAMGAAVPEPATGVEGLCRIIERIAGPELENAPGVRVETIAEGAALGIADAVDARCRALLGRPSESGATWRLRLRVRVARPLLLAVVEIMDASDVTPERALFVDVADVPLGPTLDAWLGAMGTGIETWLAGAIPGRVLALCGGDADGDGVAEVALVTDSAVVVLRWEHGGFEPLHRVELPTDMRPLARVPGASAVCRNSEDGLQIAVGMHDRNKGLHFKLTARGLSEPTVLDGIPVAWATGAPVLAQGIVGRGLIRWRGRELAAIAWSPTRNRDAPRIVGVTQDGAPVVDDRVGQALTSGTGIAAADLDGDGAFELVRTRPLAPGASGADRLVVTPMDDSTTVRMESTPITGLFGAVGGVVVGPWWRVLAVRHVEGRSMLYALGRRQTSEGRAK